jgi:hypothetical protein
MSKRRLNFVVDEESDSDILSWWAEQENKSAAIRALIRKEIDHGGVTLLDLYQVVLGLERKLETGFALACDADTSEAALNEPSDVAAALDRLGL